MAKRIGIVACSAVGAALCYRTICLEGGARMGLHSHPEIVLHGYPLGDYMRLIDADDWEGVADLMAASAEKLVAAGADFAICPDNTIHRAFDQAVALSPLPWLHIAEVVAEEAVRGGFRKLGVLGTRSLMEGPVYPEKLAARGIAARTPGRAERDAINRIIFEELTQGIVSPDSLSRFVRTIDGLKGEGCDAVVLGCTEIPLLVTAEASPLPVLDSTRLLARAALRVAVGSSPDGLPLRETRFS
jgi:aspartate racemase